MKMNKIYSILAATLAFAACDKFLDKMPDNRTELNSQAKVQALLVSAYPDHEFITLSEFSSDNVDDYGPTNPYYDRFETQIYEWQDITETDNESPEDLWNDYYSCIAASNHAARAIVEMAGGIPEVEGDDSRSQAEQWMDAAKRNNMTAEMAEALITRAYNHFILVNLFGHAYNKQTSATDLGVVYAKEPETTLDPKYSRISVAETYDLIQSDLETALPYISDRYYKVPKYHFNKKAAYAFASRFYLYHEEWDKVIEAADKCLGTQPRSLLRDWAAQTELEQDEDVVTMHFIDPTLGANLVLMTAVSGIGMTFRNYYRWARYAPGRYLATYEHGNAIRDMWGGADYYMNMKRYSGSNMDRTIFWKLPFVFEYTDRVAGIGYYRTVYPAFTGDEVLLNRAEANIHLGNYQAAVDDMNLWVTNIATTTGRMTLSSLVQWANDLRYATWDASTPKKHLNPKFDIGAEGDTKEALLQAFLAIKRTDSWSMGLRWFDIKRYGIEIERRLMGADGFPSRKTDILKVDDPRRAMQLPQSVISAGIEANPR